MRTKLSWLLGLLSLLCFIDVARAGDLPFVVCQTDGQFTEPPERVKEQIAALKADKSLADATKKKELAELEAALKGAKPIQFKENIALVLKHYDQLLPLMQVLGPAD